MLHECVSAGFCTSTLVRSGALLLKLNVQWRLACPSSSHPIFLGELHKSLFLFLASSRLYRDLGEESSDAFQQGIPEMLAITVVLGTGCGTNTGRSFIYARSRKLQYICTFVQNLWIIVCNFSYIILISVTFIINYPYFSLIFAM